MAVVTGTVPTPIANRGNASFIDAETCQVPAIIFSSFIPLRWLDPFIRQTLPTRKCRLVQFWSDGSRHPLRCLERSHSTGGNKVKSQSIRIKTDDGGDPGGESWASKNLPCGVAGDMWRRHARG